MRIPERRYLIWLQSCSDLLDNPEWGTLCFNRNDNGRECLFGISCIRRTFKSFHHRDAGLFLPLAVKGYENRQYVISVDHFYEGNSYTTNLLDKWTKWIIRLPTVSSDDMRVSLQQLT